MSSRCIIIIIPLVSTNPMIPTVTIIHLTIHPVASVYLISTAASIHRESTLAITDVITLFNQPSMTLITLIDASSSLNLNHLDFWPQAEKIRNIQPLIAGEASQRCACGQRSQAVDGGADAREGGQRRA